ncbi:MAG: cytochrome c, partial [Burkholderiales bacterium]
MKKTIPLSIRLAATLTAGALAACGGGGGESSPASSPTAGGVAAPAAAPAPAPAPGSAPAPAPAPAPSPASAPSPAPAPAPGYVPDRLKGKAIYQTTGGSTGVACMTCHGTSPTNRTSTEALEYALISKAVWNASSPGNASMSFYQNKLSGYDMQDLAAYI